MTIEFDPKGLHPGTRRNLVQVDEDEDVCRVAERNAEQAGLAERIEVRRGVAEDCLGPDERFALVIADPPWVPTERAPTTRTTRRRPSTVAPTVSTSSAPLLPILDHHLARDGAALLQVGGPDQVDAVRGILESTGSALSVAEPRWRR